MEGGKEGVKERKREREREEGEGEGKEKSGRWGKGERRCPTSVLPWSGPAQWFPVPFFTKKKKIVPPPKMCPTK